jgi:hypothetical protein
MIRVLIESPFAGETDEETQKNINYARAAVVDCLKRGEAPYASHLFFTQPGVLDDTKPEERTLGIDAGLLWGAAAEKTVVYIDRGLSTGMKYGIEAASRCGRAIEFRNLSEPAMFVAGAL